MKRNLILHPFLFGSFASLSLMAANLTQIGFVGLRALVFSILGAGLLFALLRLVMKDTLKAGLAASVAVLLFFSFGHILNVLRRVISFSSPGVLQIVLAMVFLGFYAFWVRWLIKGSGQLERLNLYFNLVALILNLMPLITILRFNRQTPQISTWSVEYLQQSPDAIPVTWVGSLTGGKADNQPDIYFIVLDAYTRADVLEAYYGYDNTPFVEFLQERGFYVDPVARSNYDHTDLSIPSALNMVHLDSLPEFLRENGYDDSEQVIRRIAKALLHENQVRAVFAELGYDFVAFDSGYEATQVWDADVFVQSPAIEDVGLWEIGFEKLLLDNSFGRALLDLLGDHFQPHVRMFEAHRERVLFTLETLPTIADMDGDHVVFAHVVSPHVPFVFGPDGAPIEGEDPYTLLDAQPGNLQNINLYRDQLHYLNQLLMQCVEQILARSDTPPIIILQADHGSKVFAGDEPLPEERIPLNFPILSAYLFPSGLAGEELPAPITPVNTFRLVLREAFGVPVDLLDPSSYWLRMDQGALDFIDVCEEYGSCKAP
jgi:hypothetical protein